MQLSATLSNSIGTCKVSPKRISILVLTLVTLLSYQLPTFSSDATELNIQNCANISPSSFVIGQQDDTIVKRRSRRNILPSQNLYEIPHKKERKRRATNPTTSLFTDPLWPSMWHLNRGPGLDMNVIEAWNLGYTGKGVVVSMLDDGLEISHPDLRSKTYYN